jgi:ribonuclease HII
MNSFELNAQRLGFKAIAGIDEAGRGPLAGPVVAAAVILPSGYKNDGIRDSKKLSPQKRETICKVIQSDALSIGIGIVEHSVIDTINILRATLLAMEKAVANLTSPPDYLLIDGINEIDVPLPQQTIIGGDDLSITVAAASIIAKVSRDHIMEKYHEQYSQYNFQKNKGYGTREHREAIEKYGRCEIHRNTFKLKTLHEK